MSEINDGGPAFPHQELNHDGSHFMTQAGMSLRDWFAGMALQGMSTNVFDRGLKDKTTGKRPTWNALAEQAYEAADAMLNERGK